MDKTIIIILAIIFLGVSEFILGFLSGATHEINKRIKDDLKRTLGRGTK